MINDILQDLIKLNEELVNNGDEGVMKVKHHNGSKSTLINIPSFSSYYWFQRNYRETDMMKVMFKENNTDQSHEQGILWMLKCMSKYHFEEYMAIAQDKKNLMSIVCVIYLEEDSFY